MSEPRIAIIGQGRMGREVEALARERGWAIAARFDSSSNARGAAITRSSLAGADVAIEFTRPEAAADNVRACLAAGCPIVTGTTGWYDALPGITSEVERAEGALFVAPNFSVGVAILAEIVRHAGGALRRAHFDAHIVETHHVKKLDAPSGTARLLAESFGGEIPITSVRIGSVPGTHDLVFDAPYEQILLQHVARDRRVFAAGALDAARWLIGRRGVFTMKDMIAADETNS